MNISDVLPLPGLYSKPSVFSLSFVSCMLLCIYNYSSHCRSQRHSHGPLSPWKLKEIVTQLRIFSKLIFIKKA